MNAKSKAVEMASKNQSFDLSNLEVLIGIKDALDGVYNKLNKEVPKELTVKIDEAPFSMIKGEKGDKGDSPTKDELLTLIEPLIPAPLKGKPGKDGKTPTKRELNTLISALIPAPIPGKDGYTPIKGVDYFDGLPGKDGSPDTGEDIIDKINNALDEFKIDASRIKNLPETQKNVVGGVIARNMYQLGDVVLDNLSDGNVLKWDSTNQRWYNTLDTSSASTLAQVSNNSTTTGSSLYTMTSGVDVEFEDSSNNTLLYLAEATRRIGLNTNNPTNILDIYSPTNSASSLVVGESLNFTANLNTSTTRHAMFTLSRIGTPGTPLTYIGAGTGATATSTVIASNNDNLLLGYDTSGTFNEVVRITTGNVVNTTGNIIPSADNTYTLGEVQNYEWSSVSARSFNGNNKRMVLELSSNSPVLRDHTTVGTGVLIKHRVTTVAQFGDGSGNPLMYLNYTPGSVYTSLATTSAGYFQILPTGGKTLIGANQTLTANAGWYYLNAGTSGGIQITTSGVSQASPVGFLSAEVTYTSPSGESFSNSRGINFIAKMRSTSTGNAYYAGYFSARTAGAGQASIARGIAGEFIADNSSGTVTITDGIGIDAFAGNNYASATVTNGYAIRVRDLSNAGTFTNYYGIYVGDVTAGTQTNQAYSLYLSDTNARSYLAGRTIFDGRVLWDKGSDIASANDITLGGGGNSFDITGTTQINTISATNWQAGSVIILQFDSSVTVKHATSGSGAQLQLASSSDFSATAGDTLVLWYDGTYWREISRTVI